MCPYDITKDGFELVFQTNHLSHFLLTQLLLPSLLERKGRIINVSSRGAERYHKPINFQFDFHFDGKGKFEQVELYSRSKLCNVLFTHELVKRYPELICYSVHPGVVLTELGRQFGLGYKLMKPLLIGCKTPQEGAQTTVFAVLCDTNSVPNGSYLSDCAPTKVKNCKAYDEQLQSDLWVYSCRWTNL